LPDSLSGDLNGAERYFRDALARALVKIHFQRRPAKDGIAVLERLLKRNRR
jgi:hypothetical protein